MLRRSPVASSRRTTSTRCSPSCSPTTRIAAWFSCAWPDAGSSARREDLSYLLERQQKDERKLSKAAHETLAIIAYHQPVTRAEIEEIRGVSTSPGTLDVLMETGWIRPRGRRRAPGRPLTYGTTEGFLVHFGLDNIKDLPGLTDLKAAGLLDRNLPPNFTVPSPNDVAALMPDELPLTDDGDGEGEEAEQADLPLDDQSEGAEASEDAPQSQENDQG